MRGKLQKSSRSDEVIELSAENANAVIDDHHKANLLYDHYKKGANMNFPKDLKYAKTDEWVKVEGEIATIGISDYAQSQLGDIVYFEFAVEPDEEVKAGQAVGSVDSAKATAEVNFPVSGTVLEINENITDDVEALNQDPYGKGWLAKIKISDPAELAELMDAEAYEAYCESR